MARKTYRGSLADVSFDGEICQHAAECVRGMPTVFDPNKRPWIDPTTLRSDADRRQLEDVIGRCPSGALIFLEPDHG
ncbi:(4Fe-4S)-binding protein [Hoyosella rhizosphaerae]|uniref:Divergent 4Fe-4S mono-cluster domain-containing protein n=1 Tax=Hoyosella rhizosphaerae TaxID=1755582 RepID=A0A916XI19_9ACTN|nr:(4Fe-4S)-binding protein [Hoyosella rhizosphaerae]MBN4928048.1 (4Fe-4S)-binding protein [Hoyosella rhizosphaerae]GGC71976.1 hypothetical protein GCM10011410_26270 [Hoyosella rhizosphaerae]